MGFNPLSTVRYVKVVERLHETLGLVNEYLRLRIEELRAERAPRPKASDNKK